LAPKPETTPVETADIKALLPWLDWALASVQAEMAGA
jgi:hypothetical protein